MESESGYASANSLRVVQRLLWATISEHLNPAEREEVCERYHGGHARMLCRAGRLDGHSKGYTVTHSCWLAFHVQVRRAIGGSLIDENDAIYQEVRACTVSSHISS